MSRLFLVPRLFWSIWNTSSRNINVIAPMYIGDISYNNSDSKTNPTAVRSCGICCFRLNLKGSVNEKKKLIFYFFVSGNYFIAEAEEDQCE